MPFDIAILHAALRRIPDYDHVRAEDLIVLTGGGIAHDHVRIGDSGRLLRLPRNSPFGLSPPDNLAYQAACFERAACSGHAPRLHDVLQPSDALPLGGLIVDFITGRPVRLSTDLPAMADCLAAIHGFPVPPPLARPPLVSHDDPIASTVAVIMRQARALEPAGADAEAQALLADELDWAKRFASQSAGESQPVTLVATDTHPGNYVLRADGRAIIVDLEKAVYGAPAIDLAHATLYTSTTWAGGAEAVLDLNQVVGFYRHYLDRLPARLAAIVRPWCLPLRRLTWLRTTTWAAHWTVTRPAYDSTATAEAKARVADFLSARRIIAIRAEWLEHRLDALS